MPRLATLPLIVLITAAGAVARPLPFVNTGFEVRGEGAGLPAAWEAKVAEDGAVALDGAVFHEGSKSLRFRQLSPTSYSYVLQAIPNHRPNQRLLATVWVKCENVRVRGIGPRLFCGYEGGLCHHARGPVLDEAGNCDWQKLSVPFNTRDKRHVLIYLYLHEATGTVWFDDLRVEPAPAALTAPAMPSPPAVDGISDDPQWAKSPAHPMVSTVSGEPAPDRQVRLAHDAEHLYMLTRVPAPEPGAAGRRGPCVQLVADPEARGYRSLTFSVAPDGTQWTSAVGDAPADLPWEAATRTVDGVQTVEMAIPVAACAPSLRMTRIWRLNVVDRRPEQEDAEVVFTGEASLEPIALADVELPALDPLPLRRSVLKTRLQSVMNDYRRLSGRLDLDIVPEQFPGRERAIRAMEDLGEHLVEVSREAGDADLRDGDGWERALAALEGLEAELAAAKSSTWAITGYTVASRQTSHPTWAIAAETPMKKVLQDAGECGAAFSDKATLSAAGGEGEAVQLVLAPLVGSLSDVRIELPDRLDGPGGGIPGSALELHEVGYVRCEKPAYTRPAQVDWWPDALLPYSPVSVPRRQVRPLWLTVWVPQGAAAGTYRGTVHFRPRREHALSLELELRVYDFSLPPRPACRTSFGLSSGPVAEYYLGKGATLPPEAFRAFCGELLRHRVSPYLACEYKPQGEALAEPPFEPWESNIESCMDRGLSSMLLSIMPATPDHGPDYDEAYKESFAAEHRPLYSRLRQRGWLDTAFLCAWDEPNPSAYPGVLAGHRLIKDTCPDLHILQTVNQDREPEELVGRVDIWCPITSLWNPDFYHARQAAGEEVWWYVCCGPHPPYATFFIDEDAIDHRLLFWQTWQQKVQGVLFWQTTWWAGNMTEGGTTAPADPRRWVQPSYGTFKVNGDGHLLYPGADMSPLGSQRLALIRDGLEDYDYLSILRQRVQEGKGSAEDRAAAEKLLQVGSDISKGLTVYTKDPQVLQQRRDAIAEMVERLRG